LTGLQTCHAESKCGPAGGGFIAITARDRNDETITLRIIDRYSGIRAKEIGDNEVAGLKQTRIIGTGEFSTGISPGWYIVQTDRDYRAIPRIQTGRVNACGYGRQKVHDLPKS
jgi:hypothetical protein